MYNILSGCLKYKVNKNLQLYIYEPNSEILFEANDIYVDVYEECICAGIMTDIELHSFLGENYLWTELEEYELSKGVPKSIEDIKVDIYNNCYDEVKLILLRELLTKEQDKLNKLYAKKHTYDHLTCHGTASFMKNYYIFENCTKINKNTKYDWKECNVINVMNYKTSNTVSDSQIREISKLDQWKSLWQTSKKNGQLFPCAAIDMTEEQKRLTFWSMFYDNIYEHHECPSEDIVEDNDMIDGWVIIQRRNREKEKGTKDIERKVSSNKIKNAHEVFIVAKNDKQAREINNLNSDKTKALKQARLNQINNAGEIQEGQFADVKQKLYMDAVRQGNEKMKGKNG